MKRFLIGFLVLGFALAIFGCTADTTGAPSDLVIYSDFAREVSEKEIYNENIINQFEIDNNCTVHFNTLAQATETFNKIDSEQIAEHYTVDLVISHYGTMSQYIQAGYIQNGNALEDEMTDRTFLAAFDGSTKYGEFRFFFPFNSDVYLAYANKTAFDHLPTGLTQAQVLAGEYTWEQYAAWGAAIGGGSVFMKGLPTSQLMYQIGGMGLSNGGTFPTLNDVGNYKAWQDVLTMKPNINPQSLSVNVSSNLMAAGDVQLAFELMAPLQAAYTAAPAQYEVFPGPKGTSGSAGSIAGGHGIGLVKNAPNPELAKKFIKWFTAPDQIVFAALGTIPTIAEATAALSDSPADQVIKKALSTISNARVEGLQMIPDYTSWSGVKGCFDTIFAGIMDGTITADNLKAKLDEQQAVLNSLKK